jgi:hypothetical protein
VLPRKKSPAQLDREIAEALSHGSSRHDHAEVSQDLARHGHKGAHGYASRPHRGRRNPGRWKGTEVQSLLFERPKWTPATAKEWARDHAYHSGKVDVTDNYVRLRQFAPVRGTQKRTITFGDGIKAVIEQVK